MSYWDTSALLKLYLAESDSPTFIGLAANGHELVTTSIARHEARTAFRRREAEGALTAGSAALCYARLNQDMEKQRIRVIPESSLMEMEFGRVLERCMSQSPPLFVRTNDALHLAAALVAGEQEFVSADTRQRTAASFLGLTVLP